MRTASGGHDRHASDLTARARIRDVAIDLFAADGFDAPVRAIAARADVSPGLVTHHFGSKAALRSECDAEVLRRFRAQKTEAIGNPGGYLLERLAAPGPGAAHLVYILRAVHAGGEAARTFLDSLVDHLRPVMAEGVSTGLVRPSRDEEARLRYLTHQAMGALLVRFVTSPGLTPDEFVAAMHDPQEESMLPTLELYTEGLLAGTEMLDSYVRYLWEPPNRTVPEPADPAA